MSSRWTTALIILLQAALVLGAVFLAITIATAADTAEPTISINDISVHDPCILADPVTQTKREIRYRNGDPVPVS